MACEGVELRKCVSVFDEQKRFNPRYDDNTKIDLEGEPVIFAIGQAPDPSFADGTEIRIERGLAQVDGSCMTGMKGVFACGEAVKAPGSVIDCIAAGRNAASAVEGLRY